MRSRITLSGVQLRRAIENAGGLWTIEELRALAVYRLADTKLPPAILINARAYRSGYEMLDFAEQNGRDHAAERMQEAITKRLGDTRKQYSLRV